MLGVEGGWTPGGTRSLRPPLRVACPLPEDLRMMPKNGTRKVPQKGLAGGGKEKTYGGPRDAGG